MLQLHPEMADIIRGLDKGAAHIMVADNPQLKRHPAFRRIAHRRGHAAIGHRHHHIGRHMAFPRQHRADALARLIHRQPFDDRIRPGEVDIFKHAEPARLLAERLEALNAGIGDNHHLARLHIAHEFRAHNVQRTGLTRQHPAIGAHPPQNQRPHPQRVARADQRILGQRHQRIGPHHLPQRIGQPIHHGGKPAHRDQVNEHFAIGGGLEQAAPPHQRPAQNGRIGQIAVMRHRQPAKGEIGIQRLHIAQHHIARGGIPVMADGSMALQPVHHPLILKILPHQPDAAMRVEALAIMGDDAGRCLAAMLQRMQPERGQRPGIGMVPNPEHAALIMRPVEIPGAIGGNLF